MTQVTAVDPCWRGTDSKIYQFATADAGIVELGSVFYCVRQKNIDDYEVRRKLDRLEMSGAGDGYGRNVRPIFALLELFVCWVIHEEGRSRRLRLKDSTPATRIAIPGTPRHIRVGSGLRVMATPRRKWVYRSGSGNACVPVFHHLHFRNV